MKKKMLLVLLAGLILPVASSQARVIVIDTRHRSNSRDFYTGVALGSVVHEPVAFCGMVFTLGALIVASALCSQQRVPRTEVVTTYEDDEDVVIVYR